MSVSSGGKKNYKSCLELTLRRIRRFEFSTNHPDPADERNELLSRPLSFCFSLAVAAVVVVVVAAVVVVVVAAVVVVVKLPLHHPGLSLKKTSISAIPGLIDFLIFDVKFRFHGIGEFQKKMRK